MQKADQTQVMEGRVVELGCHFKLGHRVGLLEDLVCELTWRWVAGVSELGDSRPRGLMSVLKG